MAGQYAEISRQPNHPTPSTTRNMHSHLVFRQVCLTGHILDTTNRHRTCLTIIMPPSTTTGGGGGDYNENNLPSQDIQDADDNTKRFYGVLLLRKSSRLVVSEIV